MKNKWIDKGTSIYDSVNMRLITIIDYHFQDFKVEITEDNDETYTAIFGKWEVNHLFNAYIFLRD